MHKFELNQTVYHRDIYDHCEPLKIVGIREKELELEGDYSGGTGIHNVKQKQWMSVKGVSYIYNHKYKKECRDKALIIKEMTKNQNDIISSNIFDLLDMVLNLTTDVSLNPEFE